MIRVSTGYKAQMAIQWAALFNGCVFRLYSGPIPAHASLAPTGNYLGYVTRDDLPVGAGNGLTFTSSANGYVSKLDGETWKLKGIATGAVGYSRLSAYNDPPVDSPTAMRIDFEANGSDNNGLILSSLNVIPGLSRLLAGFFYTIPD